jgi:hypothetical protein
MMIIIFWHTVTSSGSVTGFCEHGNEASGCINCWNFLDRLCNYRFQGVSKGEAVPVLNYYYYYYWWGSTESLGIY